MRKQVVTKSPGAASSFDHQQILPSARMAPKACIPSLTPDGQMAAFPNSRVDTVAVLAKTGCVSSQLHSLHVVSRCLHSCSAKGSMAFMMATVTRKSAQQLALLTNLHQMMVSYITATKRPDRKQMRSQLHAADNRSSFS